MGTLAAFKAVFRASLVMTLTSSISRAELNIVLTVTVLFLAVKSVKISFHV